MKGRLTRILGLLLCIIVMSSVVSGCSSSNMSVGSNTLKILLVGSKPAGFDDVVARFEELTADTLNIKLHVEWVASGDMKDTLKLRMNTGEEYDLVFDAPFYNLRTLAAAGVYQPLESYFNNDEYPGLKKSFEEDVIKANYYYGHLYSIPMMRTYGSGIPCVYYRQDLADKYGIGQITTEEQLQAYFEAILANEPDMTPLGVTNTRGFYTMFPIDEVGMAKVNLVKLSAANLTWYIQTNETNTAVESIAYEGAPQSDFDNFPAPYNTTDLYGDALNKRHEWNKYLEQDSISQKDSLGGMAGEKFAAHIDTLDAYENVAAKMTRDYMKLGVYVYPEAAQRMEPEARVTTLMANNFVCVPISSSKVDLTMKFLDWLFSSEENHDLFELGIEGEDWEPVGEDQYRVIQGETAAQTYTFPGYVLTWNPNYVKFPDTLPDDILAYKKYDLEKDAYYVSPLAGFNFDVTPVTTEAQIVKETADKVTNSLAHGTLDDPVTKIQENRAAVIEHINVIKDELERQINEFLANKDF